MRRFHTHARRVITARLVLKAPNLAIRVAQWRWCAHVIVIWELVPNATHQATGYSVAHGEWKLGLSRFRSALVYLAGCVDAFAIE